MINRVLVTKVKEEEEEEAGFVNIQPHGKDWDSL